jgi:hypothetical protein
MDWSSTFAATNGSWHGATLFDAQLYSANICLDVREISEAIRVRDFESISEAIQK